MEREKLAGQENKDFVRQVQVETETSSQVDADSDRINIQTGNSGRVYHMTQSPSEPALGWWHGFPPFHLVFWTHWLCLTTFCLKQDETNPKDVCVEKGGGIPLKEP